MRILSVIFIISVYTLGHYKIYSEMLPSASRECRHEGLIEERHFYILYYNKVE